MIKNLNSKIFKQLQSFKHEIYGLLIIAITILIIVFVLLQINSMSVSKKYVYMMNSYAEDILNRIKSNESNFKDYCKKYDVPHDEIIYLFGTSDHCFGIIIDANKYCSERKNITVNPVNDDIALYWAIKFDNDEICEIWTSHTSLEESKLKQYSYNEQIDMIPSSKKEKFDYAIGYFKCN